MFSDCYFAYFVVKSVSASSSEKKNQIVLDGNSDCCVVCYNDVIPGFLREWSII